MGLPQGWMGWGGPSSTGVNWSGQALRRAGWVWVVGRGRRANCQERRHVSLQSSVFTYEDEKIISSFSEQQLDGNESSLVDVPSQRVLDGAHPAGETGSRAQGPGAARRSPQRPPASPEL